jgi:hypothetical protein
MVADGVADGSTEGKIVNFQSSYFNLWNLYVEINIKSYNNIKSHAACAEMPALG